MKIARRVMAALVACMLLPASGRADDPAVAVAVDLSVSMRGFAATGAMERVLLDFARAVDSIESLRDASGRSPQKEYFGVGPETAKLPSVTHLWRGRGAAYGKSRADLENALRSDSLRAATVAALFTDGQPSATRKGLTAPCEPGERPTFRELQGVIQGLRREGRPVWLLLERVSFQGTIFLNCGSMSTVLKQQSDPGIKCRLGGECRAERAGERAMLTLLVGAPRQPELVRMVVAAYLDQRLQADGDAVAIDLAGAPPMWKALESSTKGWLATSTIEGSGVPGRSNVRVRCHERSLRDQGPSAARIRVAATRQTFRDGMLALWDAGVPRARVLHGGTDKRLHLLGEFGFEREFLLQEGAPTLEGSCTAAWNRYERYWQRERERGAEVPVPAGCGGHDTSWCADLLALCDCGRPRETSATIVVAHRVVPRARAVRRALEREGLAVDHGASWLAQLERIEGLGGLIEALGRGERPRRMLQVLSVRVVPAGAK